ncbi:MAG: ABC transporter permease [Bacteroidales bacterium]|nr:ABC transporter permease [Bacteroidales bacterium]
MKIFRFKSLFKISSLLNILGISVAVAAFYILMVCVEFDINFNKEIPDYERIYMCIKGSEDEGINNFGKRPVGEAIIKQMPFIENGGCFSPFRSQPLCKVVDGKKEKLAIHNAPCTKSFLETFSIKFSEGSIENFSGKNKIIISRSVAEKFSLKAGDYLSFMTTGYGNNSDNGYEITAIFEDFPKNSEIGQFQAFIDLGDDFIDDFSEGSFIYYFKAKEGVSDVPEKLAENSTALLKSLYADEMEEADEEELEWYENVIKNYGLTGVSLKDLHFYREILGFHIRADKKIVYTLFVIAVLTVIIAYINYINFFFSQIPQQLKAVNIKKIHGCSRATLIVSIVLESVVFSSLALVAAYCIVRVVPALQIDAVIGHELSIVENIKIAVLTSVSVILAAVLSSLYPAFFITGFQPALALKGVVNTNPKSKMKYFLTCFQLTASIALIISTTFIKENNDYILEKDLGFNRSNLLSTYVTNKLGSSRDAVRERLLQNSDIEDIAWADGEIVSKMRMGWGRVHDGKDIEFQCYPVSWNFLKFLGVEIAEGRDFQESDEKSEAGVFIFNEAAKKAYNLSLDMKIWGHVDLSEIVGFCKDFNYKPLQYGIEPFAFYVFGEKPWRSQNQLYLRTKAGADLPSVVDFVKATLIELDPDYELSQEDIITFDREVRHNYSQETNLSLLVTMFTFTALLIALTGLLGIVLFEAERRRKEIGIRKVNGATIGEILMLFNKRFIYLVLISFVIACPIAYCVVMKYFSNFTYHCPVYVWIFVAALVRALFLTVLTVSLTSLKAANENPVKTLKTE